MKKLKTNIKRSSKTETIKDIEKIWQIWQKLANKARKKRYEKEIIWYFPITKEIEKIISEPEPIKK